MQRVWIFQQPEIQKVDVILLIDTRAETHLAGEVLHWATTLCSRMDSFFPNRTLFQLFSAGTMYCRMAESGHPELEQALLQTWIQHVSNFLILSQGIFSWKMRQLDWRRVLLHNIQIEFMPLHISIQILNTFVKNFFYYKTFFTRVTVRIKHCWIWTPTFDAFSFPSPWLSLILYCRKAACRCSSINLFHKISAIQMMDEILRPDVLFCSSWFQSSQFILWWAPTSLALVP